jgi:hypothetical protein
LEQAAMTAATGLDLRAWQLPEPVSWWPPAPGWWLLTGLFLVLILLLWRSWSQHQRRANTRQALRELAALQAQFCADADGRRFAIGVSQLLRRVALTRYPPEQVAGLSGMAWLEFLAATGGEFVHSAAGHLLIHAAYQADAGASSAADCEHLRQLAMEWIRKSYPCS